MAFKVNVAGEKNNLREGTAVLTFLRWELGILFLLMFYW